MFIASIVFNILFLLGVGIMALVIPDMIKKHRVDKFTATYNRQVSVFEAMPKQDGAIVFLGNSITEDGRWGELFGKANILNRGIGGDKTVGLLGRIDEVTRHQPTKLFIAIGTNDLNKKIMIEEIMQDYTRLLDIIKEDSPTTKVYLQSVLPVGKKARKGKNEAIIALNEQIKVAAQKRNMAYIDLHSGFKDASGELNLAYSNDDLHLNGKGYFLWKKLIKKFVEE